MNRIKIYDRLESMNTYMVFILSDLEKLTTIKFINEQEFTAYVQNLKNENDITDVRIVSFTNKRIQIDGFLSYDNIMKLFDDGFKPIKNADTATVRISLYKEKDCLVIDNGIIKQLGSAVELNPNITKTTWEFKK